tara:strand:- start:158 stop:469 length:312 start_codon:yes stop_codon:yes gene_type:complete
MNEKAKESCPLCLAQPCDWVTDPHKATDALFLATADLRIKSGVGEKPMLSDLPQVIGDRLGAATQIISALKDLAGAKAGKTVHGKDADQWRYKAQQWLLMEPE